MCAMPSTSKLRWTFLCLMTAHVWSLSSVMNNLGLDYTSQQQQMHQAKLVQLDRKVCQSLPVGQLTSAAPRLSHFLWANGTRSCR
jgi:hypothetical protein